MAGRRDRLGRAVLLVWAPLAAAVVGLLMVNHTVAMPGPEDAELLNARLAELRDGAVVHVVAEGCSCTDRLFQHLVERGGEGEHLLYVGSRSDRVELARAAGYVVESIHPEDLARRWGLRAAPVLLVGGRGVLYAGGYFRRPAALVPRTEEILTAIDAGEPPPGLPVFGCAVETELRRAADPLGLQDW